MNKTKDKRELKKSLSIILITQSVHQYSVIVIVLVP